MRRHRLHLVLASALALILVIALGPAYFLGGLVIAVLPVPLYVLLALWLDRNEPEPAPLLIQSFIWGMLVASLVSLVMNAAAVAYTQLTLGLSAVAGQRAGTLLASPLFEEISKGAALFLIFRRQRDEFDDAIDGAVYAAMVGLGFATTENILYYGHALQNGQIASVFAIRGLAAPFAHPLFTAMTGVGFGAARNVRTRRSAIIRIGAGLASAVMLHALWNAAGAAHMFVKAYALIMVPTFAGVLLLLTISSRRERQIVRSQIEREMDAAAESDVAAVCRNAGIRGWLVRRTASGPRREREETAHRMRRSAVELAFACWHGECAGNRETERVTRLRLDFNEALAEWRKGN